MNEKNTSSSSDCAQRIASVVTTSALSLTLLSCVDPSYISNNPGSQTGGAFSPPPSTRVGQVQFSDQQAYNKYSANGYNYIDAKVLAKYWGESSPSDAKLRMGRKMLNFGPQDGRANINSARSYATRGDFSNWPVFYSDGGYSFQDAEIVGAYWGGDVVRGKMKLARNLIQGHDDWNRSALAAAR